MLSHLGHNFPKIASKSYCDRHIIEASMIPAHRKTPTLRFLSQSKRPKFHAVRKQRGHSVRLRKKFVVAGAVAAAFRDTQWTQVLQRRASGFRAHAWWPCAPCGSGKRWSWRRGVQGCGVAQACCAGPIGREASLSLPRTRTLRTCFPCSASGA